jgi:hypothetical protein
LDNAVATTFIKYTNSAARVITETTMPAATQELVKVRAGQVSWAATGRGWA